MSIFTRKTREVVLCSPLEGRLTLKGKPAAGAKITRWFMWKDKKGESEIYYADERGYFSLPIAKGELKSSTLAQLVVSQLITVQYQAVDYEVWTMGKDSEEVYGELGGKPVNFRCELSDEVEVVGGLDGALLGTSCKWDSIEPQ